MFQIASNSIGVISCHGLFTDKPAKPSQDKILPLVGTLASGVMVFNFCKAYLLDHVDLSKI